MSRFAACLSSPGAQSAVEPFMAFAAEAHQVALAVVAGIFVTVVHHTGFVGAYGAERMVLEL